MDGLWFNFIDWWCLGDFSCRVCVLGGCFVKFLRLYGLLALFMIRIFYFHNLGFICGYIVI